MDRSNILADSCNRGGMKKSLCNKGGMRSSKMSNGRNASKKVGNPCHSWSFKLSQVSPRLNLLLLLQQSNEDYLSGSDRPGFINSSGISIWQEVHDRSGLLESYWLKLASRSVIFVFDQSHSGTFSGGTVSSAYRFCRNSECFPLWLVFIRFNREIYLQIEVDC